MRKGISEIISSVLLLAIAVSIAGVYSQWAPQYSEDTAEEIGDQANNQVKCNNAVFDIYDVKYDLTSQRATFRLSNKGTINFNEDITITAVNASQIIGQKTINSLEVEETQLTELPTDKIPEILIASSQECPDLEITEEQIDVQK